MIMTTKQQLVTALLAVLIVVSVMAMPRVVEVPHHAPNANRVTGTVAAAPAVSVEISSEQVKDLTYN